MTDDKGEFKVTHRTQKEGIEPGKYKVTFSKFTLKDGSPIPEGKDLADVDGKQSIPANYSDANKTKVTAEVPAKGKSFTFELNIKK